MLPEEIREGADLFGLIKRKHRRLVALLRKLREDLVAGALRRTVRQHKAGLLLESDKLIVERVVLEVAHDLAVFLLVHARRAVEYAHQLPNAFDLIGIRFHIAIVSLSGSPDDCRCLSVPGFLQQPVQFLPLLRRHLAVLSLFKGSERDVHHADAL